MRFIETLQTLKVRQYCTFFQRKHQTSKYGLTRPTSRQNFNLITVTVLLGGYWITAQINTLESLSWKLGV